LEVVTIPDSVYNIEFDAFSGCLNLMSFNVTKTSSDSCWYSKNSVLFCGDTLVKYPPNKKDTNYVVSGNQAVSRIIRSSFEGCNNLQSVTIPASVTRIERHSFVFCKELSFVEYQGKQNPADDRGGFGFLRCQRLGKVCVSSNYTSNNFCGEPVANCHRQP